MFKSRRIAPNEFVKEFLVTLAPGIIPRKGFIQWKEVEKKCGQHKDALEFYCSLGTKTRSKLIEEIADGLLSTDDPTEIIKGAFQLLGHTNDIYVSEYDHVQIPTLAKDIQKGSQKTANYCAKLWLDLGLSKLLETDNIFSAFLGVQVGLESNRRKNVGGKAFGRRIGELLASICTALGPSFTVRSEQRIPYRRKSQNKKVDFAILRGDKVRIGVEANFFTVPGSKPTEIKRAYGEVTRRLKEVDVELVWITDGAGYHKMKRSLGEAFQLHPNTYNYHMAKQYLEADIRDFIKS